MTAQILMNASPLAIAAGIIVAAFISEDAATLAAATLAASKAIEPRLAFLSSVAGIWLGDLGLYALAYRYGSGLVNTAWGRRLARPESLARGEKWFQRRGALALFLSRCMPGTRLPISLAAGVFRMRASRFATVGAAGAFAWVALNFTVVRYSSGYLAHSRLFSPWLGTLFFASVILSVRPLSRLASNLRITVLRWSRWEFWPAWFFYLPVAAMWVRLAVKHRSLTLPAIANPGQRNGGLVGESKFEILQELRAAAPAFVAEGFLLTEDRIEQLASLLSCARLQFPFILKPNIGQRGAGFKKVNCFEEAEVYLQRVVGDVIAQTFVEGPKEIGIFYVRLPGQTRGDIVSITEKTFPCVTGDGVHTLEELIRSDRRARHIADTYLSRFGNRASNTIPDGERVRLVEAGNHCQGCIFGDGSHLYSEALRSCIDEISQSLPGFYVGRYDIRYADDDLLRAGLGFHIIELNGAASEATSIYDARNRIFSAYRTLWQQWSLVFQAGAENRERGHHPPRILQLWRDWRDYTRRAANYPLAD